MDNSGRGCLSAVRCLSQTGNSPSSCACAHPKKKGERAIEILKGRIHTPCLRARTLSPHSPADPISARPSLSSYHPFSCSVLVGPYEIVMSSSAWSDCRSAPFFGSISETLPENANLKPLQTRKRIPEGILPCHTGKDRSSRGFLRHGIP